MKRNLITRETVVKANEAMVRSSSSGGLVASGVTRAAVPSAKTKLSSTEINKAYAAAKKCLAAA
uniref:Uncharacterized protein n=1 Tax=Aromatoleum anaerobium TaxID=182180 RepID=A0ABX1PJF7_9RHOO